MHEGGADTVHLIDEPLGRRVGVPRKVQKLPWRLRRAARNEVRLRHERGFKGRHVVDYTVNFALEIGVELLSAAIQKETAAYGEPCRIPLRSGTERTGEPFPLGALGLFEDVLPRAVSQAHEGDIAR